MLDIHLHQSGLSESPNVRCIKYVSKNELLSGVCLSYLVPLIQLSQPNYQTKRLALENHTSGSFSEVSEVRCKGTLLKNSCPR